MNTIKSKFYSLFLILTFVFIAFPVLSVNAATTITTNKDATNIKENGSELIEVTDSSCSDSDMFTVKSADKSIATVDALGFAGQRAIRIVAKNYGSTTITITSYDKTVTKDISVNVYCSTFSVDDMIVAVGKSVAVTPKFTDGYTYDVNNMTFDSENTAIASVSGAKITGVKVGETTVTATVRKAKNSGATEDVVKTFKVKVVQPVESIEIAKSDVKVNAGESFNIGAVVKPENATVKELSYTADNDNVEVDKTGKVTGKKAGKSVITVASTDGSKIEKKVNVTVVVPVTELHVNAYEREGFVGESLKNVDATVNENATDKTITYKSRNEKVATVDDKGNIKAVGVGNTEIEASAGGITKTVSVSVLGEITSISANKEITVTEGIEIPVDLKVGVENNIYYGLLIEATIDDTSIATVNQQQGGVRIKGKKAGFAILTISSKNPTQPNVSCTVKVIVKPTQATETETVPVVKKAKAGKRYLTVTVGKMTNITGYQVQVATDKKFKKNKKSATGVKTKIKVKKLKKGKKYYVRVRTYSINASGKKVYSQWSKAIRSKKVK